MKIFIVPTLFLCGIAVAQTAEAPKPPIITDAQKLAYFKANSEYQTAAAQAQQAAQAAQQKQVALGEVIKAITDACGKNFQPTMDAKGYPSCASKTEPVKPVEVAK